MIPTQRCTWKFSRRKENLLGPVKIALEEANPPRTASSARKAAWNAWTGRPGPPCTVSVSLVRVLPSGETVSLPELSGRFGPFKIEFVLRWAARAHLDGADLFASCVLDVGFAAIQLGRVSHADEVDVVDGHGESERQLIARLRDLQSERFGIGLLAIDFLAIETPCSYQRFRGRMRRTI